MHKTLVVKGHRIRLGWILKVFYTDGIKGVEKYVMKLLPEYKMEDILKSSLYYLYLKDKRIKI